MLNGIPSTTITFAFRHYNSGLADGDFTKTVLKDGVADVQTVTISEVGTVPGGSIYTGSFDVDSTSGAYWHIDIVETGDTAEAYQEDYFIYSAAPTVTSILAGVVESEGSYTLQQALSIILAAVAGRTTDLGATFKTPNNAETRIAATVNSDNERTAITLTPSA